MALKEKLNEELKSAMKAGNAKRLGVFRLLISAIKNKEIEKKGQGKSEELTDEEIVQLLTSEAKKRKEAITIFIQGNRSDLAEGEKQELEIIQEFLPKLMSAEETEKAVSEVLAKTGAKEIGPAMKEVMKELRGKADPSLIGELVKKKLSA